MGGGGNGFGFVCEDDFKIGFTSKSNTYNNDVLVNSNSSNNNNQSNYISSTTSKDVDSTIINVKDIHQYDILNIECWSFNTSINRLLR